MSLTKSKGGQGTPGTTRMGNMPKLTETDGRGGETSGGRQDVLDKLDAQRPGPARRVTRAYQEDARTGRLSAQGKKGY